MSAATGWSQLARELCDALGLKQCRSFTLSVSMDECITVRAECIVADGQIQQVVKILHDSRPAIEMTVIGDEYRSYKPLEVAQ